MRSIVGGGEIAGVKRNFKEGDSAGYIVKLSLSLNL